jgi:hypothetical protein
LISRQPHHATRSYHPTRANTPQPNEFEYLDVFDLFNFPRLHTNGPDTSGDSIPQSDMHQMQSAVASDLVASTDAVMMPNFPVPNPEEDWLFHTAHAQ